MMGKSSKKLKRKNQQKNDTAQQKLNREAEQQFDAYYGQGKYAEALDYLAEMIKGQDIKPDYLYKGAVCYFMQKDYDRAAQWVVNTLNFAPGHIDARILLARICFQQERSDDGLAILEVLAKGGADALNDIQRENMEEIAGVHCRNNRQSVKEAYPALAKLFELDKVPTASDTLTALQKLKDKLASIKSANVPSSAPVETVAEPPAKDKAATPQGMAADIGDRIRQVKEKSISVAEKIRVYNSFAGASYVAGDLDGAECFLKEALLLDEHDEVTIRNLAMILARKGDKEKALAAVTQLKRTDFVLLQAVMDA